MQNNVFAVKFFGELKLMSISTTERGKEREREKQQEVFLRVGYQKSCI